jgi:hypothetical protein
MMLNLRKQIVLNVPIVVKRQGHYLRMQILSVFQNILDKTTTVY